MKKRNGFTLIELLAVIIVLAIIALIAMPIIFNVIENAKLKALENSTYGLIDAVRMQYMENLMNSTRDCDPDGNPAITTNCGGVVDLTGSVTDLTVSGEQPSAGTWTITNTKDAADGTRGIAVTGVVFQSMKDYTCANDVATGKVTCTK